MKYLIVLLVLLSPNVLANLQITEVMPNPVGLDRDVKPGGEWVELYNPSLEAVDISDCILYDSEDKNELYLPYIEIEPNAYFVAYRNLDSDFNLNNARDKVRLFCNKTLIDEMSYYASLEGMSKSLVNGEWIDQMPTPMQANADVSGDCEWKVSIYSEPIADTAWWKTEVRKDFGEAKDAVLYRVVRDMKYHIVKEYAPLTLELSRKKTVINNPRLKPGTYFIQAFLNVSCNDSDYENNNVSVLIHVSGQDNNTSDCPISEIVINKTIITGNIAYESNDAKARKYAAYIFCFLLILLIISMKVENNATRQSYSKNNDGSNRVSKRTCRSFTERGSAKVWRRRKSKGKE